MGARETVWWLSQQLNLETQAPEFADTVSTEEILRPLAEASGGSVRRIAENGEVTMPGIVPVRAPQLAGWRLQ